MTARRGEPKENATQPPPEVRNRAACGPTYANLFPAALDIETSQPVLLHPIPAMLTSANADVQRFAIDLACRGTCAVRSPCLRWALETGQEHGAWGGKTQRQLARLRGERDTSAA